MKLTKQQLIKVIKEELNAMLAEGDPLDYRQSGVHIVPTGTGYDPPAQPPTVWDAGRQYIDPRFVRGFSTYEQDVEAGRAAPSWEEAGAGKDSIWDWDRLIEPRGLIPRLEENMLQEYEGQESLNLLDHPMGPDRERARETLTNIQKTFPATTWKFPSDLDYPGRWSTKIEHPTFHGVTTPPTPRGPAGPEGEGGVYDVEDGGYSYLEPAGMSMQAPYRPGSGARDQGASARRGGIPHHIMKKKMETSWLQDLLGKDSSFRLFDPKGMTGLEESIEERLRGVLEQVSKKDAGAPKVTGGDLGSLQPEYRAAEKQRREKAAAKKAKKAAMKKAPAKKEVPPPKKKEAPARKEKSSTIKGRADDAFAELDALEEIKASFKKFL